MGYATYLRRHYFAGPLMINFIHHPLKSITFPMSLHEKPDDPTLAEPAVLAMLLPTDSLGAHIVAPPETNIFARHHYRQISRESE